MSQWLNNKVQIHFPGKKSNFGKDEKGKDMLYEVDKPCHSCGFCPFGQLVEEFPLGLKEEAYAIKHNKYVKWDENANPKWVSCDKNDKGASPDLNWAAGKVKNEISCEVFGHSCPVYYMAEPFSEE